MPTNDFLPIATAGGANVQTQVAYAADPDRTGFFADGIAPDANQHGKMFRQVSSIISALAQCVCDLTGLDMLDNGVLATLITNLKTMFASFGTSYWTDTGAANVYVITPSPAIAAYVAGQNFFIKIGAGHTNADGASTINVNGLGAKALVGVFGINPPAGTLKAGQVYQIVYDGTQFILPTLMSRAYVFGGSGTFTWTGYVIDELGFIEQWGSVGGGGTGGTPASFPLTFPTACYFILGSANESPPGGPGTASIFGNAYPAGSSTFQATTTNVAYVASWMAKGR